MRLYTHTHTHTHTHGYRLNDKKGITLIALIITIIVLLILAGISISAISGDDGIISRAGTAKEKSRAGEIKDIVGLTIDNNKIAEVQGESVTTKEALISQLVEKDLLTAEEEKILDNQDIITIEGVTIDFTQLKDDGFDYLGRKYLLESLGYTFFNKGSDMVIYDYDDNVIGQIPAVCMTYNAKLVTISGTGNFDGNYRFSEDDHYIYLVNDTEENLIGIEDGYCKHHYEDGEIINCDISDLNDPKIYCKYCGDDEAYDCQYINGVLYSYNVEMDFRDTNDCWYRPLNGYSALVWDKTLETVEFEEQINGIDVVEVGGFQTYTDTNTPAVTNVIFPSNVKIIKGSAFGNSINPNAACKNLESIILPNSVTTIKRQAFSNCTSLSSITISNNVVSIGEQCFAHCDSLTEINYTGTIEEWKKIDLDEKWNYNNWNEEKSIKVICTDGELTY